MDRRCNELVLIYAFFPFYEHRLIKPAATPALIVGLLDSVTICEISIVKLLIKEVPLLHPEPAAWGERGQTYACIVAR